MARGGVGRAWVGGVQLPPAWLVGTGHTRGRHIGCRQPTALSARVAKRCPLMGCTIIFRLPRALAAETVAWPGMCARWVDR